jgi:hypothetical protein
VPWYAERRQADPGPYVKWALAVTGPGCISCLSRWAQEEDSKLQRLLDVAAQHPTSQALRAIAVGWPVFLPSPRTRFEPPVKASDVPGGAPIEAHSTRLVAAVAQALGIGHGNYEVAELQAENPRHNRARLRLVSRTAAVLLSDDISVTSTGDICVSQTSHLPPARGIITISGRGLRRVTSEPSPRVTLNIGNL